MADIVLSYSKINFDFERSFGWTLYYISYRNIAEFLIETSEVFNSLGQTFKTK